MFRSHDLEMVHRMQDELRRDAAQHRLAARIRTPQQPKARTRRVLGLRLSLGW
jgi:hypothetical protein